MRKLSGFIFLLLYLPFVLGCHSSTSLSLITTQPIITDEIIQGESLTLVDLAEYYHFEALVLPTYQINDDSKTTYVNISEFLDRLQNGLIDYQISYDNGLKVSFPFVVPIPLRDDYGTSSFVFTVLFQAHNNQILINNVNLFQYLNEGTTYTYYTNLRSIDAQMTKVDSSAVIDLSKYGMEIAYYNENYYIPLYLANLFFTGNDLDVFQMGSELIVYDSQFKLDSLTAKFKPDPKISISDVAIQTENFLALYMDYFYGLKEHHGVDSYIDVIRNYSLSSKDTFESFHQTLSTFLNDQNDPHTAMLSAGYNNSSFTPSPTGNPGSKVQSILLSKQLRGCSTREDEFRVIQYSDMEVWEINAFTERTKNFLNNVSVFWSKTVVIDLTCNTGGLLAGVLELLTYMTDEPIQIVKHNPFTDQVSIDTVQSTAKRGIDVGFIIVTSQSTYSAANLFVSIAKDMNLALIIGENSLGGACATQFITLPDGAIIVSSSNTCLLNQAGNKIEDGVSVDYEVNLPIIWNDINHKLDALYHFLGESKLEIRREENRVYIDFDVLKTPLVQKLQYRLISSDLFIDQVYDGDFSTWIDMTWQNRQYTMYVEVSYEFNGVSYTERIEEVKFDDYSDDIEPGLTKLEIDKPIMIGIFDQIDRDCFQIEILEAGLYRIELLGQYKGLFYLFDSDKNYVTNSTTFSVDPGIYYIQIGHQNAGDYQLVFTRLLDDTLFATEIEIPEGEATFSLYVDYARDPEMFEFTITERSHVKFSLDLAPDQMYSFFTISTSDYTRDYRDLPGNQALEIILGPGTYTIHIFSNEARTVTLTTTLSTEFTDYADTIWDNPDNFGSLYLGKNVIHFEADSDIDIYVLVLEEDVDIVFMYDQRFGFVHDINDGTFARISASLHHYKAGTYYFRFTGPKQRTQDFMLCELVVVDTLDTEDLTPITIGEYMFFTITSQSDIDTFTFVAPKMTEYVFTTNFTSAPFRIYDSNNNLLFSSWGSKTFSLAEGTYIIEFGLFGASASSVRFVALLIEYQTVPDAFPNSRGLPLEYYPQILPGEANAIHSALEYNGDVDILIFYIDTAKRVRFEKTNKVSVLVYDQSGNYYHTDSSIFLNPGVYYLVISNVNKLIVDYTVRMLD